MVKSPDVGPRPARDVACFRPKIGHDGPDQAIMRTAILRGREKNGKHWNASKWLVNGKTSPAGKNAAAGPLSHRYNPLGLAPRPAPEKARFRPKNGSLSELGHFCLFRERNVESFEMSQNGWGMEGKLSGGKTLEFLVAWNMP